MVARPKGRILHKNQSEDAMKIKEICMMLLVTVSSVGFSHSALADGGIDRYPYRLPDWIWDSREFSHLLTDEEILNLRSDIKKLDTLKTSKIDKAADKLAESIAVTLAQKFSTHDLERNARKISSRKSGLALDVLIDPTFGKADQVTIERAVSKFLDVALDRGVIGQALARSSAAPQPMPQQYEIQDGKEKLDAAGRPVFTDGYKFYLSNIAKPASVDVFHEHLKYVLSPRAGKTPVLVISAYSGNIWWGGGYYGYFSDPIQVLRKEAPSEGYLYIRLNTDKFKPEAAGWNDENFWASKLAHEILHNLSYWHPAYQSIEERQENNKGNDFAFIYSYEIAILEKLTKGK